jgi:hypothetical protein
MSIDDILPQARLLADHAFRAGTLPENSRIFEEIDKATRMLAAGERPPLAPLINALNHVSAETGVTVAQLQRRGTTVGRFNQRAALATPYLIGFLTLLLTLYLSFQSRSSTRPTWPCANTRT